MTDLDGKEALSPPNQTLVTSKPDFPFVQSTINMMHRWSHALLKPKKYEDSSFVANT